MPILRKPMVVKKFKSFHDYVKKNDHRIGQKQRGIDVNLNNAFVISAVNIASQTRLWVTR